MYYIKITNISKTDYASLNGSYIAPLQECWMNEIGQLTNNPVPLFSLVQLLCAVAKAVAYCNDKNLYVDISTGSSS